VKKKDTLAGWLLFLFVFVSVAKAFYKFLAVLELDRPIGTALWYLGIAFALVASGVFLIVHFVQTMDELRDYENQERERDKKRVRRSSPHTIVCSPRTEIEVAELPNEKVSNMIKRKGVCDVCSTEFELDEGSFGIKIMEDHLGPSSKKWTITVSNCVDGCFEEDFSQVCGMTCLYKAISEVVGKKTKESDLRIVGYDGVDDSSAQVLDLRDKKIK